MNRNESFDVLSTSAIELSLAWASLEVMIDDVEQIQVMIAGSDEDMESVKIACEEGHLKVEQPTVSLPRVNISRWMQVMLRIPTAWKGAVSAATVSGAITARSLVGTDLKLETVTGVLRAFDLEGLTVALHTVTADLQAEQITAPKLNLRTVSGDMHVSGSSIQSIRSSSVTGALTLDLADAYDQLDATTVSGNIVVNAPVDVANVSLRAVSGRLRTDGVSLNDGGAVVSVTSVSGDLTLNRTL